MTHTTSGRRKGVVAVFVAIGLMALMGVVALSIDGGLLYVTLRQTRSTADAAAMAAACELFRNYPKILKTGAADPGAAAFGAARKVAQTNGFSHDDATCKVEVNIPPKSGPYSGRTGFAEVIITYQVQRAFSRIWGNDTLPVRARAVARGAWVSSHAGVLILDYEDKASLNSQGNGAFTETGGAVIVNSNNPSAVLNTGNGKMIADEFHITGGIQLGGNASLQTAPVPGKVYTGTHPTPDPLAYLPPPEVPADGSVTTVNIGNGNKMYLLTPGRHANLPTFNTGDVVILKQASYDDKGIYYIDSGGFKSTGATIFMDPTTSGGVMLYNNAAGNTNSDKIQITGNPDGRVNLSGLTDGPYSGLSLWQRRDASVDLRVEGNGNFSIRGTFYAAGAKMNVNGNGKTAGGDITGYYYDENGNKVEGISRIASQFIVKNLSLGGNGNVKLDYTYKDKARTRIISLVE